MLLFANLQLIFKPNHMYITWILKNTEYCYVTDIQFIYLLIKAISLRAKFVFISVVKMEKIVQKIMFGQVVTSLRQGRYREQ